MLTCTAKLLATWLPKNKGSLHGTASTAEPGFSRRLASIMPLATPAQATKSSSMPWSPALTAATSRVSGPGPAKMELPLLTPFEGNGDATHPQGASSFHWFSRLAAGRLRRRSLGHGLDGAERTNLLRFAWQQYSTVLQTGNAEMVLSAIG